MILLFPSHVRAFFFSFCFLDCWKHIMGAKTHYKRNNALIRLIIKRHGVVGNYCITIKGDRMNLRKESSITFDIICLGMNQFILHHTSSTRSLGFLIQGGWQIFVKEKNSHSNLIGKPRLPNLHYESQREEKSTL